MAQLGNTTITGTLGASGAVAFGATLAVTGAVTFGSTLGVTGAITAPTLILTGAATLSTHAVRKGEFDAGISGLGSVYQPLNAGLTSISGLTTTSYGRGFLVLTNAAAARTVIGVVPGTDVQAYDGTLAALSGKATSGTGNIVLQSALDSVVAGLKSKNKVRAATTANGTMATAFANGQTVDGVVLATDDRVMLKNQTTPAENGVYTVNASGAPTRAEDWDEWDEVIGAMVAVEEGTTQHDTLWISTADKGGTLGTTAITFSNPFAFALLAANNLSDLGNAGTALTNLGGSTLGKTIFVAANAAAVIAALGLNTLAGYGITDAVKGRWLIKSANYTAVVGDRLQTDTSGGVFAVTLPASPSAGDEIPIEDAGFTWGTNNLTVARNGLKINGGTSDFIANVNGGKLSCVYINSTIGWSIK